MRKRRLLIALAVTILLPFGLVGAAILAAESEWAEERIEQFASERLNRAVRLNDVDIQLAWPPRVHLATLRVANPDWARTKFLIDAEDLTAAVELWPLFTGGVVIDMLTVAQGRLGLEQEGTRATWRFGARDEEERRFKVQQARVEDAWIFYRNEDRDTALHIHATAELDEQGTSVRLTAEGRYRGEPAKGTASAPALVFSGERPMRASIDATVGPTSGSATGTFQASSSGLESLDIALELKGATLAHLHDVFGLNLPNTPPYHLQGNLTHSPGMWRFDPFSGEVGDSDLRGSWSYDTRGEKPMLRADITSKLLDFNDLGPTIGAPPAVGPGETASAQQKRQARALTRKNDFLPEHEFDTAQWDEMNADVKLKALRVDARPNLPINGLTVHATLENSVLRLQPLKFDFAGGVLTSNIVLDANATPLKGSIDAEARSIDLSRMFPQLESTYAAVGRLYGHLNLTGRGGSVAALLGSSDGEAAVVVRDGYIAGLLVEALGLDLAEALAVLAADNTRVPLRCAVADLAVTDGLARLKTFVIDTRDTLIRVRGSIDFADETLDLVTLPRPKDPSLFSVRTPVHLSGPLRDPNVRLEPAPIAGRVIAGGLLALVNPLLAVLPFIEPGTGADANCRALLEKAQQEG